MGFSAFAKVLLLGYITSSYTNLDQNSASYSNLDQNSASESGHLQTVLVPAAHNFYSLSLLSGVRPLFPAFTAMSSFKNNYCDITKQLASFTTRVTSIKSTKHGSVSGNDCTLVLWSDKKRKKDIKAWTRLFPWVRGLFSSHQLFSF